MKNRLVSLTLTALLLSTSPLKAALGSLLANYNTGAADMVLDPVRSRLYATIPSTNSIMVINTITLSVVATIPVGASPAGLSVSPDGSRLYVANSGLTTGGIGVLDLASLTALPSINTPVAPWDVKVGVNNQLYVTTLGQNASGSMRIDATTGAFLGYFSTVSNYAMTNLQISPDRTTLYAGDVGLSPARLAKYDVSGPVPVPGAAVPFGSIGSNGEKLVLNHNGQYICDVVGSGNGNPTYNIRMIPTGTLTGGTFSFVVGAYPNGLGFSPDDTFAYANAEDNLIKIYDTTAGTQTGQFTIPYLPSGFSPNSPLTIVADATGSRLFVSSLGLRSAPAGFEVFDTGRSVPEPASGALFLCGGLLFGARRRRHVRGNSFTAPVRQALVLT